MIKNIIEKKNLLPAFGISGLIAGLKYRTNALLLFATVFLVGCAATLESETENWFTNTSRLEQMKVLYPNLALYLDEDYQKAVKMKETADAETDSEVKLKTLIAANDILKGKLYVYVNSVMNMKLSIQKKQEEINKKYADERNTQRVMLLFEDANNTMKESERLLKQPFTSKEQAIAIASSAKNDMSRVETSLRNYIDYRIKQASEKMQEEDRKLREGNSTDNNSNATTPSMEQQQLGGDQPSTKKCGYCNTVNKADASQCTNCKSPF